VDPEEADLPAFLIQPPAPFRRRSDRITVDYTVCFQPSLHRFDVCVTVHHIWQWREVPTWCNNY